MLRRLFKQHLKKALHSMPHSQSGSEQHLVWSWAACCMPWLRFTGYFSSYLVSCSVTLKWSFSSWWNAEGLRSYFNPAEGAGACTALSRDYLCLHMQNDSVRVLFQASTCQCIKLMLLHNIIYFPIISSLKLVEVFRKSVAFWCSKVNPVCPIHN